jgi:hypothetical protein
MLSNERINRGYIAHETFLKQRDGRSRFHGRGKITRAKRRGAGDRLPGAQRKRGLQANSNLSAFFYKALPRKWRPMHINFQIIGKPFVYRGKPKVGFYYDSNRTPLPNIGKFTHTNFRVLNTVKKLDDVSPHGDTTILLQWSRGGIPKVRNIRVDGVSEERSYTEEAAYFLDKYLGRIHFARGKIQTWIHEYWFIILVGILVAILMAIDPVTG